MKLTQDYLKSILTYNPETGIFTDTGGQVCGDVGNRGYARQTIKRKRYQAHRLAWLYVYGEFPQGQIDHINQIKTDNRIANLRDVTCAENQRNQKMQNRNKSGFTGVCWDARGRKWHAQITVNRKNRSLGRHACFLDAVAARIRANKKYGFHENHGSDSSSKAA